MKEEIYLITYTYFDGYKLRHGQHTVSGLEAVEKEIEKAENSTVEEFSWRLLR